MHAARPRARDRDRPPALRAGQRDHRRAGPGRRAHDADRGRGRPHGRHRGRAAADAVLRRVAHDQRQRRADGARVDSRLGHADDADRAHEHALGRGRARCSDRGGAARRVGLEPARRRRDLGRAPERHQRLPRPAGARPRRARGRARGTGRGGLGRRRHRHGLPRLQGWDRHSVARRRGRLDGGRARAGESWPALAAARERHPGRRAHRPGRRAAARERRGRGRRLDHRPDRDRRAAAPGAVRAGRAARRLRDRAYGGNG